MLVRDVCQERLIETAASGLRGMASSLEFH